MVYHSAPQHLVATCTWISSCRLLSRFPPIMLASGPWASKSVERRLFLEQTSMTDLYVEKGWRSGESGRLPPLCPGFDSDPASWESWVLSRFSGFPSLSIFSLISDYFLIFLYVSNPFFSLTRLGRDSLVKKGWFNENVSRLLVLFFVSDLDVKNLWFTSWFLLPLPRSAQCCLWCMILVTTNVSLVLYRCTN